MGAVGRLVVRKLLAMIILKCEVIFFSSPPSDMMWMC